MAFIESSRGGKPLYRVRWNYRRDDQGKQRFDERQFRDKREAVAFDRAKSAAHTVVTERITVGELFNLWEVTHFPALSVRTADYYRTAYRRRIGPFFAARRITTITALDVTRWQEWMVEQGHSANAANKSLATLKSLLAWGRSKGYTQNGAVSDTKPLPSKPVEPPRPYTPAEVERIAAGCKRLRDAAFVTLAAYSGLRYSELRALKWSDIDWQTEEILLRRSANPDGTEKTTKSNRERVVPVLKPGIVKLAEWRAAAPGIDLVFPGKTGRPINSKHWYTEVMPAIREASGIDFDVHQLRDTYASILIASGVEIAELTLWLGHTSFNVTLRRYGRLYTQRRAAGHLKANALLESGGL